MRNCAQTVALPATESQARPLVKLNPDQQREAWLKAIQTAPEGGVTARPLEEAIGQLIDSKLVYAKTSGLVDR